MIKNNFNIRNTHNQINTNPIEDLNNHLLTIIDLARKIKGKENHNLNEVEKLLKNIDKFNSLHEIESLRKLSQLTKKSSEDGENQTISTSRNSINLSGISEIKDGSSIKFGKPFLAISELENKTPLSINKEKPMIQIFKSLEREKEKNKNKENLDVPVNYELSEEIKADSVALSIIENSNLYPIKFIGKGGFARVYLCKSKFKGLDTKFAVKVINHKQDEIHKSNELNANKKLNSPYITKFYDSIKFDHNLIIVLEFIDNGTIKDLMMKHGDGLPELCVYYLFNQIVGGIEDMHNQKIIHRDIKPDNIGLTSNFDIKIFDFTTAKSLDETDITQACGTLNYMSPQYIIGKVKIPKEAWIKLDTFSLGVVLYYLTYGREPYKIYNRDNTNEIVNQINSIDWLFDSSDKEINPDLKDLINNLITIDDKKRLNLFNVRTSNWFKRCKQAIQAIQNKMKLKEKILFQFLELKKLNLDNYFKITN